MPRPTAAGVTPAAAPFDDPDADIILRSCDGIQFRTYKLLLSLASPIFKDMLAIPQPPPLDRGPGELPVVDLTEKGLTIRKLLYLCYPAIVDRPDPSRYESLEEIADLIEAITKYEIWKARKAALQLLVQPDFLDSAPLKVYAIACRFRAEIEAHLAAKRLLGHPLLQSGSYADLEMIDCQSLHRLLLYHKRCTEAASKIAHDTTWIEPGPYSWLNCKDHSCNVIIEVSRGQHIATTHRWFLGFLERTQNALERAVSAIPIADDTLASLCVAAAAGCEICGPHIAEELAAFIDAFQEKIDDAISEIHLDLGFWNVADPAPWIY